MRKLIIIFLLLFTSTFFSIAQAQEQDGSFFLQACDATVKQSDGGELSQQESLLALYCASYISGFLDATSLTSFSTKGQKNICTPDQGIANDQAARILVKYLRENPELLHQSGRTSVYVALVQAFPCKK
jgi:Rap1a immunity proteins